MKMTTPSEILAERAAARTRGGLAHTYNSEGQIVRDWGCSCYECRDFYDPEGVEDARLANERATGGSVAPDYLPRANAIPATEWRQNPVQIAGARGFLARADAVGPMDNPMVNPLLPPRTPPLRAQPQLQRADGVQCSYLNEEDAVFLPAGILPPPPAPRLERQRAVCYDENGVDILAVGRRVTDALRGMRSDRDRGSRFELGPEHAAIEPLRNLVAHYEQQLRELQTQNIMTARELETIQMKLTRSRDLLNRLDSAV
jgi:hypothetical protein